MRWHRSKLMRAWMLCASVACVMACSDSDDPDRTIDEKTAERQALGAVEVQDAMIANTDEIATGSFADLGVRWLQMLGVPVERAAADPTWDAEGERWLILVGYESDHSDVDYVFAIQYTNEDGSHPMQPGSETTNVGYGLDANMRSRSYGNGDAIHADLHYGCTMDITQLHAASYAVTGHGATTGVLDGRQDGRDIEYELDVAWVMDAAVPRDGRCGNGTITVEIDSFDLIASYEPSAGTYAWEFSRWGTPVSSGHGTAACGKTQNPVTQPAPPPRD